MSKPQRTDEAVSESTLPADRIDVWSVRLDIDAAHVDRLRNLLSADERARADRFAFDRDRRRFVVGRGAVRSILASYLGAKPAEVRFTYGPHGKPFLADSPPGGALQFNASGSQELAVCAVTLGRQVGIDIEASRPIEDENFVAQCLAPAERQAYATLSRADQSESFYRLWTRKEAYLKGSGAGLSRPLSSFEVSFLPGEKARLVADHLAPTAAEDWTFADFTPAAPHIGALVIFGQGRPVRSRLWSL
jgi:4'-phosphopantetheinyl transferase